LSCKPNENKSQNILGFEIVTEEDSHEFFSPNHSDLVNLKRIFKAKMIIQGFHDHFHAIKKIGKGNFATVNFFIKFQFPPK